MESGHYIADDLKFLVQDGEKVKLSKNKAKRVGAKNPGNKGVKDHVPTDFDAVMAGCAFLQHCRDDAESLPEPEWWAMVSILACCQDGARHVHELSSPYPGYCPDETDRKIKQCLENGGPHRCETIQVDQGDTYCGTCPNKGRVTSPIVLGRINTGIHPRIAEMNREFAVARVKNGYSILQEVTDPLTSFRSFNLLTRESFNLLLANRGTMYVSIGGKPKPVPIAEAWLRSPFRREFPDGIVFDPSGMADPERCYNLYNGFAVEPKPGDWSLFKEHIQICIAGGDQRIFEYILAWMADLVQHPGGPRPGTAIVMTGKQGTGKGVFANTLGNILGQHFVAVTDAAHLTGKFNGHLAGMLLCFVDEALWAGDKAAEGVLKARITEPTMLYEAKGRDAFQIANHTRFIIASNNAWVVPAGLEERRFLVVNVSDKHSKDYPYFMAIQKEMEAGGYEAMHHDLLQMDLRKINLREIPRTACLLDQIFHSLPPVQKYWLDCLHRNGSFAPPQSDSFKEDLHWEFGGDSYIPPRKLYADFLEWCRAAKVRHPGTEDAFFKDLRKVCNVTRVQRTLGLGTRKWYYQIPALDECRRQFEEHVDHKIDWHDKVETGTDPDEIPWHPRPEDSVELGFSIGEPDVALGKQ